MSLPASTDPAAQRPPTPITIITGFLGAGKTTLILNLLPQLPPPPAYTLALLKNEFGDLAIDSQLASSSSIAGVKELLNGCICCNLVGQLGDALLTLRKGMASPQSPNLDGENPENSLGKAPDRIIIETSGSAFPATLCLELNRLARETKAFTLDGVISVIDVENWQGYEDTSVTAKMQAKYTDLIVLNKWEDCGERRLDEVLDRLGDLEDEAPRVKSTKGWVGKEVVFGIDGGLASAMNVKGDMNGVGGHTHGEGHMGEVEVLSVAMRSAAEKTQGLDLDKLETFLAQPPKDEVYRIKAVLYTKSNPKLSVGEPQNKTASEDDKPRKYILNWAFGRWNYTLVQSPEGRTTIESVLRMTVVTGLYESTKWQNRLESGNLITLADDSQESGDLVVRKIS